MKLPNYEQAPESLSGDPNVFERTLILEQLAVISEKISDKLSNPNPEEHYLENGDYDLILQKMDELGKIGYFSTPGYLGADGSGEVVSAEPLDKDMEQENGKSAEMREKAEELSGENAIDALAVLLEDLNNLPLPADFTDRLYFTIEKNMKHGDPNSAKILELLYKAGIAPKSADVVKNVAAKILENNANNLYLYVDFVKEMSDIRGQEERLFLNHGELLEVQKRVEANPSLDRSEILSMRSYVDAIRQEEEDAADGEETAS